MRGKEVFICILILLLIPIVYSISDVTYESSDGILRFNYTGDGLYRINIRRDSKIGEDGGYVWAKTSSGQYQVDTNNWAGVEDYWYSVEDTTSQDVGATKVEGCLPDCTQLGKEECVSNQTVRHCTSNPYGCLTWSYYICEEGTKCIDGKCVADEISCTDSDNGMDYYVKGTTYGKDWASDDIVTKTDYCITGGDEADMLTEYYCKENQVVYDTYKCPDVCSEGECVTATPVGNIKDMTRYSDREAFLISDKDWRNVFQFIPLAIWTTDNQTHKKPLLIFHEEANSFDADSIIHFLQQYNTEKVTLVGDTPIEFDKLLVAQKELGVGLSQEQIQRISSEIITDYWISYDKVVYVQDDYKLAMMASVYASLINAPLIIEGGALDIINNLDNRQVILVGEISCPSNSDCAEKYDTLESLQKKYIELTNTDKIIMVNPNDMNYAIADTYETDLGGTIDQGYRFLSMSAPLLAASKKEIIFFEEELKQSLFTGTRPEIETKLINHAINVRKSVISKILKFFPSKRPEFLTIMASPDHIPQSINILKDLNKEPSIRMSADISYANKCEFPYGENPGKCDLSLDFQLKTGRIYGITNSDVSSYIMRSLFYDELWSNIYSDNEYTGLILGSHFWHNDPNAAGLEEYNYAVTSALLRGAESNGYSMDCYNVEVMEPRDYVTAAGCTFQAFDPKMLEKKQFITYLGHGDPLGWTGIPEKETAYLNYKSLPKLDLSVAHTWVCLTNSFINAAQGYWLQGATVPPYSATKAFAPHFLRQGGMAYFGMTEGLPGGIDTCPDCKQASIETAFAYLISNIPIGEVFNKLIIEEYPHPESGLGAGVLLGDPTLIMHSTNKGVPWEIVSPVR